MLRCSRRGFQRIIGELSKYRLLVAIAFLVVLVLQVFIDKFPFKRKDSGSQSHKAVNLVEDYKGCFQFNINNIDICGSDYGSSLPLFIIITSSVTHSLERQVLRDTWAGYARTKGAKTIFLLGRTEDLNVQKEVETENSVHKDIVQTDCLDTYRNLTLKSVAMMKWIVDYCFRAKVVLKTDDDVHNNVNKVLQLVQQREDFNNVIIGYVFESSSPFRWFTKWKVSEEEFQGSYYPRYTCGPFYLFSNETARLLYKASLGFPYLFLEDVFMTGIVAENLSIRRIHEPTVFFEAQSVAYCNYNNISSSHGHSAEEMSAIWNEVNRRNVVCNSNQRNSVPTLWTLLLLLAFNLVVI